VAAAGSVLTFLTEENGWTQVQFQDPQFGLRTGWVQNRFVRVDRPELQPLDLSVPTAVARQNRPPRAPIAPLPEPTPERVRIPEVRDVPNRVHLDADFMGFFPLKTRQTATATRTLFGEQATASATYLTQRAGSAIPEPSVNVLLGANWLIGFRFFWYKMNYPAGIAVSVPHPLFLNRPGTDDAITTHIMERSDMMFDFNVGYVHNVEKWRYILRVGPSYLRSTDDRVNFVSYIQNAQANGTNTVFVVGSQWETVKGIGLGANASGDVSFFPWRHVGFGGGAFMDFGYVRITDPLTDKKEKVNMNSVTLLGGPRFRF
jgi:hypothetical protein